MGDIFDILRNGDLRFTVPGAPVGKGRHRTAVINGHARQYTPEKTVAYEGLVGLCAQQALEQAGQPYGLTEAPVRIALAIWFDVPASWSKKKRAAALEGSVWPTKKPDCSNILKAIEDALNGVVWKDDVQVVQVAITKKFGPTPCVNVTIQRAS